MTGLTDRIIRGMKPNNGERLTISDDSARGVRGLSVMASYGGTKTFYFRYKTPQGKLKRIRIGGYPSIALVDARKKARDYKRHVDNGTDLASLELKASLTNRKMHTIQQLWSEYHSDSLSTKKSALFENQLWNKHAKSHFGNLDLRSFTRDTILDFLVPFRRTHSPALAARVQAIISQLGAYAVERRVLEFSPAYQLGKKKKLPSCDRYLSRYELAKFWASLSDSKMLNRATVSPSLAYALQLALCTCARRGEIAGMQWDEFDLVSGVWTIPSNRTKNGRAHVIPLNQEVIELLRNAKNIARRPNSRFVFPGRRTEHCTLGAGHIRGDAITRATSRICKILIEDYDIQKFTPHDLRRTAATYMASALKVDRFTISQILNHTSDHGGASAVTDIYARYDYMEEKTIALKRWVEFIETNSKSFL